jgi:hypothetical protein
MAKLPTRRKVFDLVGESYENTNGSSRQEELLACEPGEPVQLVREPDNPHGADAVLVQSVRGVGVGYLRKEDAAILAPELDAGRAHSAKLHCLRGGVSGYPTYGAQISISWDGAQGHPHVPLDDAQVASRRGKRAMAGRSRDASGRLTRSGGSGGGCAGAVLLGVSVASFAAVGALLTAFS